MKKLFVLALTLVLLGAFSCAPSGNSITIKGSDTEVNLVTKFAKAYMKKNPSVKISVTGGGSGTGIAALINGRADIANASRMIKDKEVKNAEAKNIKPTQIVIATDGVCVIVNPDNKVKQLTMKQLAGIFKGEIKNWKEVGGDDVPIVCYGRQSNSGTYSFFKKTVLKKQDFGTTVKRMNGNSQIVTSVKKDKGGIGYVGVGYVKNPDGSDKPGIVALKLSKDGNQFFAPTDEDVMSSKYPLTRPLNQYVNGMPKGEVKKFLQFSITDPEAKKIVKEVGFFPIQSRYDAANRAAGLID